MCIRDRFIFRHVQGRNQSTVKLVHLITFPVVCQMAVKMNLNVDTNKNMKGTKEKNARKNKKSKRMNYDVIPCD